MIRYSIKLLSLLLMLIPASILPARPSGNPYIYHNEPIDYPAIGRIIDQEFNRYFQPYSLSFELRKDYETFTKEAKSLTISTIRNSCSDHTLAKEMAKQLAYEYAIDFVLLLTRNMTAVKLNNILRNCPPINPEYIKKDVVINSIVEIIREEIAIEFSSNNGKLDRLIKNLSHNIDVLLDQELQ